jgi:20S proteasome subunit alpha 7
MFHSSDMPLKELAKRVANYMHVYTLYSAVRPFGATIMMGSWTEDHGAEVRKCFKLKCIS